MQHWQYIAVSFVLISVSLFSQAWSIVFSKVSERVTGVSATVAKCVVGGVCDLKESYFIGVMVLGVTENCAVGRMGTVH